MQMIGDLFEGHGYVRGRERQNRSNAHPANPGSGPVGKTCRHCRHYTLVEYHNGKYRKCALITRTNGAATDIRAGDAACSRFVAD